MSNETKPAEQADKTKPQPQKAEKSTHPYEKFRTHHEKDGGLNIFNFRDVEA